MADGEAPRPGRRDPWRAAFVAALLALAGSIAFLGYSIFAERQGESAASAAAPVASSSPASHPVLIAGAPPADADLPGTALAPADAQPDLRIERVAFGGIVHRYFVPVAAIGAGVDALSSDQLRDVASGKLTNWKDVGGVPGKVSLAVAGPPDDQELELEFLAGTPAPKRYDTYDALRAAMAWDSGMLALVPLAEVRPGVIAVAVDGTDVARGRGNAATWPFVERFQLTAETARGREALPGIERSLAAQLPRITRVVATGDILQSRCSLTAIEATKDWAAALRSPVGEYLAAADLALGSLDGSITDFASPYGCVSTTNLTSPAQVIQALTLAGIDELTVATNHVFDCGQTGPCSDRAFLRTLQLVHDAGIKTVGGGKNLDEALAPAVFEVNGVRFGVLGFDDIAAEDLEATTTESGTAPLDDSYKDEQSALPREPAFYKPPEMLALTRFEAAISALKNQVDVVIVQVQTGFEDTHEASPRSIKALRAAAAAGADLVVGNQGHHVQPVEVIGDTWVSYALGNFIFDQVHTPDHTEGYLLEATFWDKRLANVRMVPYHIVGQYKPTFVDGATRAKILGDVMAGTALLPKR